LFGGRIAEEMTLGKEGVTTGASNDIERATGIARNMVTKWGLSEKMGPLMYEEAQEEVFLGKTAGSSGSNVSGGTRNDIDIEIRRIVDECYSRAEVILADNRDKLDAMAETLMQYETIDVGQINAIMEGRKPGAPSDWDNKDSGDLSNDTSEKNGSSGDESKDTKVGGPASGH
jgi:cell division protease FtsH